MCQEGQGPASSYSPKVSLLTETSICPRNASVTCPKKVIQTYTRQVTTAWDYLQPQKAGSKLNGGCLGNNLINRHTTRLRLHSNPHATATRVEEHGHAEQLAQNCLSKRAHKELECTLTKTG